MYQQNMDHMYNDITALANEVTLHSYRTNWTNTHRKLFRKLSTNDYAVLYLFEKNQDSSEQHQKIYLEEIAQGLHLPIARVSKVIRALKEQNLVTWKHDGIGEEGTYVQLTEKGAQSFAEQQEILRDFYQKVIKQFGRERFIAFLKQIIELEEIMDAELDEEGNVYE